MYKLLAFLVFLFPINLTVSGQGCSDAGACSVDILNFSPGHEQETRKVTMSFDQSLALGEHFIIMGEQKNKGLHKTSSLLPAPLIHLNA